MIDILIAILIVELGIGAYLLHKTLERVDKKLNDMNKKLNTMHKNLERICKDLEECVEYWMRSLKPQR